MGWHDMIAGNRYLQWKRELIGNGFTVSDQLVSGNHSILFDDIKNQIAFVCPQFCGLWNYSEVRHVGYDVKARLFDKVRYELKMMTSDINSPLGNVFIETTNSSEPERWVAKILAHCNR
jgi:hypothetical protein